MRLKPPQEILGQFEFSGIRRRIERGTFVFSQMEAATIYIYIIYIILIRMERGTENLVRDEVASPARGGALRRTPAHE